jgi:lipopolysaccharide transport system ATP-binding protein
MNSITVRNVGKRYRLGGALRHDTLRDHIAHTVKSAGAMFRRTAAGGAAEKPGLFWALREVSFDVGEGEVLGIIGRNGAGKSTLLKILSQITDPTEGEIHIRGRITSLLEVGTGFHPELSGRENIFLNGAILGMSRAEIRRKFDEIAAFAEVETFLDTPVKHYSSGMYVRLAFAVAANLDPEIMIIDEVLAVGDAAFQRKCLGKMENAARSGRTILFVSHNLPAVESLCHRCLLLEEGRLAGAGATADVLRRYQERIQEKAGAPFQGAVFIKSLELRNASGEPARSFAAGESITAAMEIDTGGREIRTPFAGLGFDTAAGRRVFTVGSYLSPDTLPPVRGRARVVCQIPSPPLAPGAYAVTAGLGRSSDELLERVENAASFQVIESDFFGNGRMTAPEQGPVLVRSRWSVAPPANGGGIEES